MGALRTGLAMDGFTSSIGVSVFAVVDGGDGVLDMAPCVDGVGKGRGCADGRRTWSTGRTGGSFDAGRDCDVVATTLPAAWSPPGTTNCAGGSDVDPAAPGPGSALDGGVGSSVGSGDSTAGPRNMSAAVCSLSSLWPLTMPIVAGGAGCSSTCIAARGSDRGRSKSIRESGWRWSVEWTSGTRGDGRALAEGGPSRTSEVKASTTAG